MTLTFLLLNNSVICIQDVKKNFNNLKKLSWLVLRFDNIYIFYYLFQRNIDEKSGLLTNHPDKMFDFKMISQVNQSKLKISELVKRETNLCN